MPKISSKRQITLTAEQCREAGIQPGDEYTSYVDKQGHITILPLNKRDNRTLPSLKNETGNRRKIPKSLNSHPREQNFSEALQSIPDVGSEADFERIDDNLDQDVFY